MADFGPLGGVKITGFISPVDTADEYAVTDSLYGIDGFRNITGGTIALNNVGNLRRRAGMVVGVSGGTEYYRLKDVSWQYDATSVSGGTDWDILDFSLITPPNNKIVPLIYNDVIAEPNNSVIPAFGSNTLDSGSTYSNILGGSGNTINDSNFSSIFGGDSNNTNSYSAFTNPVGLAAVEETISSSIGGGSGNTINSSFNSHIVGGVGNIVGKGGGNLFVSAYNRITNTENFTSHGDHTIIGGGSGNTMGTSVFYSYYAVSALSTWDVGKSGTNVTDYSIIIGGKNNQVLGATNALIGGGENNVIGSSVGAYGGTAYGYKNQFSTIINGKDNVIGADTIKTNWSSYLNGEVYYSTIINGSGNTIERQTRYSIIGGGIGNIIRRGSGNMIGAGKTNRNEGSYSIIGAGDSNYVNSGGKFSIIGSGVNNYINGYNNFIGGGSDNTIQKNQARNNAIVGGSGSTIYNSRLAFIGGGLGNSIGDSSTTFSLNNLSFIGAGEGNEVRGNSIASVIGGGQNNRIGTAVSSPRIYGNFIGGGDQNGVDGSYNSIVGGKTNVVSAASYGFIGGGFNNQLFGGTGGYGGTGSTIVGGGGTGESGGNQINRASYALIGGGAGNVISYNYVGALTSIYSDYSVIIGGMSNQIHDSLSSTIINSGTINGESGVHRILQSDHSIIGGGSGNYISGGTKTQGALDVGPAFSGAGSNVILAGYVNEITDSEFTTIVNGLGNTITDTYNSSILGGRENYISGVTNTHIIGSNITGITANTTYVNNLNINDTPSVDNILTDLLVRGVDGTVKIRQATSISGATGTTGSLTAKFAVTSTFVTDTPVTINHNMGLAGGDEFDILVQLRDTVGGDQVGATIDNFTSNTVDVTFSQNYAAVRIVIIG